VLMPLLARTCDAFCSWGDSDDSWQTVDSVPLKSP
jgi:hypothetical protein